MASLARAAFGPVMVGGRRMPSIGLVVLAAIGAMLLAVVATTAWPLPTDEQAYWRAAIRFASGGSMYDPTTTVGDANYGYYYPPPLVQVLAPFTSLISANLFSALWTVLLLVCLWWLGGRDLLTALALIAFLPVAVELRARNIHLVLAVLAVLALRRSPLFWVPATAIKVSPVVGIVYLLAGRRWRDALLVMMVGAIVLALSVLLAPGAWTDFIRIVLAQAGTSGASILPWPFPLRFGLGASVALIGGLLTARGRSKAGEGLLLGGMVLANPTLWVTALSMLIALVPLWRRSSSAAAAPAVETTAGVPQVSGT